MRAVDVLLRYPLFAAFGRPALDTWAEAGQHLSLQVGQTLMEAGARGNHVFVLLEGRVRVSRPAAKKEHSLEMLEPGQVFGEYALLRPHVNTATCRASEPCSVFRLPLSILQLALRRRVDVSSHLKNWLRLHALVHHFRNQTGLGFLSGPSLLVLLDCCQEIAVKAARTIQADGLLADSWLFIRKGEVAIHTADMTNSPLFLGPGDCFAERALLGKSRLPVAVALADLECWRLRRDDFMSAKNTTSSDSQQSFRNVPTHEHWEWLAQRSPSDCSIAALAMAMRGLGFDVALEDLALPTPIRPCGASLADLSLVAQKMGVLTTSIRVGLEQLRHVSLPAVAHLSGGHYVTLFKVRENDLVVGDPAVGIQTMEPNAFRAAWSGHLLLIRPAVP